MTALLPETSTLELKSAVLCCKRFKGYDVIADELEATFLDYKIRNKVVMATTDRISRKLFGKST